MLFFVEILRERKFCEQKERFGYLKGKLPPSPAGGGATGRSINVNI
jgi:hypothetical protein